MTKTIPRNKFSFDLKRYFLNLVEMNPGISLKIFLSIFFIFSCLYSNAANAQDTICYRLIGVDNSIFRQFYLVFFDNNAGDTLFVMSAKAKKNPQRDSSDFGEKLIKGECYEIEFSRKDSLFGEKLGRKYSLIEHLEIKYGSKIFWEDHLIQLPVYYTDQIYDLYYKRKEGSINH